VAILPHREILKIHGAVIEARLTSSRAALLGGIEAAFTDFLPICASPSSQILSDLHALNAAGPAPDGALPLAMWLANALALVGERGQASVFRAARTAAEAPCSQLGSRGDAIAEDLLRIGRAVLLSRGPDLRRCLYEVEELLAQNPHQPEARLLRERIQRAMDGERHFPICHSPTPLFPEGGVVQRLRAPPSLLLGRERQLSELSERLGPGGALICGLAGAGKTALALALLRSFTPRYPDLQISLDLRGTSQSPLSSFAAMERIVRAILPRVPLPERADDLGDLYRALFRGQRALLFLEDALDRSQIEPLLPPNGSVVVITSRRRLTLPGIHTLSLDELEANHGRALMQHLAPAVDGATAEALVELCGGSPLALRLAGSALAARPDLTGYIYIDRLRDAQSHHTQIDAALSVAYALLDPLLQALWAQVGAAASSFSLSDEGAEASCAFPSLREALGDLVARAMLEHDPVIDLYRAPRAARDFARSCQSDGEPGPKLRSLARPEPEPESERARLDEHTHLDREKLLGALSAARRVGLQRAEVIYLDLLIGPPRGYSWGDYQYFMNLREPPEDAALRERVALLEQALDIHRAHGDREGEERASDRLLLIHALLGGEPRALRVIDPLLRPMGSSGVGDRDYFEELRDRAGSDALNHLISQLVRARMILSKLGDQEREQRTLERLAMLHSVLRNERDALELEAGVRALTTRNR